MPFMLLIKGFVMFAAVWALFHTNPQGVDARALLVCNIAILALAVPVAIGTGVWLYDEAVAVKANEKGMATFLTITAGGTAATLFVAFGGLIRNVLIFPHSRRNATPVDGA